MYKNQLQELAQRSCFNLPSYSCIREGPDHAPRFKAVVNFNGETFESPAFCGTLRQAEHAAAEVALNSLSKKGPSKSLAARVLDETGVYKNLLQETAHRAGLNLPVYTTVRSGPGHTPVFTCTVELAGMSFSGDPAKTKKQAQKNAAMAAWSALKQLPQLGSSCSSSLPLAVPQNNEEKEQAAVARALANLHLSDGSNSPRENDWHYDKKRPVIVEREANSSGNRQFYSVPPYHGWVYSNFFSEIGMHQALHQQYSHCQQSNLFTVPVTMPSNDPRFYHFVQSIPPTHNPYFPVTEQDSRGPLPCFPGSISSSPRFSTYPSPVSQVVSQLSIQEIDEEKSNAEENGLFGRIPYEDSTSTNKDAQANSGSGINETSGGKANTNNPGFKSVVSSPNPSIVQDSSVDTNIQEIQEAEGMGSLRPECKQSGTSETPLSRDGIHSLSEGSQSSACPSASQIHHPRLPSIVQDSTIDKNIRIQQAEGSERLQSEWKRSGVSKMISRRDHLHSRTESSQTSASSATSQVHHPPAVNSLSMLKKAQPRHVATPSMSRPSVPMYGAGHGPHAFRLNPSMMAAPVTMRTAIPVHSARPTAANTKSCVFSSRSMAPPVNVRSVNPVCSAPVDATCSILKRPTETDDALPSTVSDVGKLHI